MDLMGGNSSHNGVSSSFPDSGDQRHVEGKGVELYTQNGRALSIEERQVIARRRGICVHCGVRTHQKGKLVIVRQPITNEDVYQGHCIRCEPEAVAADVRDAWNVTHRIPAPSQGASSRLKGSSHHAGSSSNRVGKMRSDSQDGTTLPSPIIPSRRSSTGLQRPRSRSPGPSLSRKRGTASSCFHESFILDDSEDIMSTASDPHRSALSRADSREDMLRRPRGGRRHVSRSNSINPTAGEPSRHVDRSHSIQHIGSAGDTGTPPSYRVGGSRGVSRTRSSRGSGSKRASLSGGISSSYIRSSPDDRPTVNCSNHSEGTSATTATSASSTISTPRGRDLGSWNQSSSKSLEPALVGHAELVASLHKAFGLNDEEELLKALDPVIHSSSFPNGSTEVVDALSEIMETHMNRPDLTKMACLALWRISSESAQGKHDILAMGVCSVTLTAVRKHMSAEALGLLTSLCSTAVERQVILQDGGIEAVLTALGSDSASPTVFMWACRCLISMITTRDDSSEKAIDETAVVEEAALVIEDNGGIAMVLNSLQKNMGYSQAELWALKLVAWLYYARADSSSRDRVRRILVDNGFVEYGISILDENTVSNTVFSYSAEIMARIAYEESSALMQLEDVCEVIPAVVSRMNSFKSSSFVQSSGCRLLVVLCQGANRKSCLHVLDEMRAVNTLAEAVSAFSDDNPLVESTLSTLAMLMSESSQLDGATAGTVISELVKVSSSTTGVVSSSMRLTEAVASILPVSSFICALEIICRSIDDGAEDLSSLQATVNTLFVLCRQFPAEAGLVYELIGPLRLLTLAQTTTGVTKWRVLHVCAYVITGANNAARQSMTPGLLDTAMEEMGQSLDRCVKSMLLEFILMLVSVGPSHTLHIQRDLFDYVSSTLAASLADSAHVLLYWKLFAVMCSASDQSSHLGSEVEWISDRLNDNSLDELEIEYACNFVASLATRLEPSHGTSCDLLCQSLLGLMNRLSQRNVGYRSELIDSVAFALTNILKAMKTIPLPVDAGTEGVSTVISMIYKVLENNEKSDDSLIALIRALAYISSLHIDDALQKGVVLVAIDVMTARVDSASVQTEGFQLLQGLVSGRDPVVAMSIIQADGVHLVASAFSSFPEVEGVYNQGCRTLASLCVDEATKKLILSQDGLRLTADAASMENSKVLESVVEAMLALTKPSPSTTSDTIREAGVLGSVMEIIAAGSTDVDMTTKSIIVLKNITTVSPQLRKSTFNARGLQVLSDVLESNFDSPPVIATVFSTLTVLVGDEEVLDNFPAQTLQTVICAMLAALDDETVKEEGCQLFAAIASKRQVFAVEQGAFEATLQCLRASHYSISVQTSACSALAKLSMYMPDHHMEDHIQVTEPGIRRLLATMRRYPESGLIQEYICRILCNILDFGLEGPAKAIQASGDEIQQPVQEAASRFPDTCSTLAAQILSSVSR